MLGEKNETEAGTNRATGKTEMATKDVEALVELLIESGRALVPPPDPQRAERVWRRLLAALDGSSSSSAPRRLARMR